MSCSTLTADAVFAPNWKLPYTRNSQSSYPAEVRKWNFSPFFSAKGVVKLGVKFWWNFPRYVFQGLGVRRKISPKFHVKNGVKNGKFHANFTLLGRSAENSETWLFASFTQSHNFALWPCEPFALFCVLAFAWQCKNLMCSKNLVARAIRNAIRANRFARIIRNWNPYFYSASGRFARITRISDSRESPDSRESCESIRANHATKSKTWWFINCTQGGL